MHTVKGEFGEFYNNNSPMYKDSRMFLPDEGIDRQTMRRIFVKGWSVSEVLLKAIRTPYLGQDYRVTSFVGVWYTTHVHMPIST